MQLSILSLSHLININLGLLGESSVSVPLEAATEQAAAADAVADAVANAEVGVLC